MSSFEDDPNASFYPMGASVREIVNVALSREGRSLIKQLTPDQQAELGRLLMSAVHDGVEFGESIAALPDGGPTKLEHYTRGYTDALDDLGQPKTDE